MKTIPLLFLFIPCLAVCQPLRPVSGDCHDAKKISVGATSVYGPTVAPDSFGKELELRSFKTDLYCFEKEHNSAWYRLEIRQSGNLLFDVIPTDSTNDYDFLLYRISDSLYCRNIAAGKIRPVRSNISRCDASRKGRTGLSADSKNDYQVRGPGSSHSRMLEVTAGEQYILVLDNVYDNGKGHTLKFSISRPVELSGTVKSSDSSGLVAEVRLSDRKGTFVAGTTSNAAGEYRLKASLSEGQEYILSFFNDSSFVGIRTISGSQREFPPVSTVLPRLKAGSSYVLDHINFYGNEARFLPASMPSLEALLRLMQRNRSLTILVEGHVNGVDNYGRYNAAEKNTFQGLSEQRAEAVKAFLAGRGIDTARIATVGMAEKKMLYPKAVTEEQRSANRRVEIRVIRMN